MDFLLPVVLLNALFFFSSTEHPRDLGGSKLQVNYHCAHVHGERSAVYSGPDSMSHSEGETVDSFIGQQESKSNSAGPLGRVESHTLLCLHVEIFLYPQ